MTRFEFVFLRDARAGILKFYLWEKKQ